MRACCWARAVPGNVMRPVVVSGRPGIFLCSLQMERGGRCRTLAAESSQGSEPLTGWLRSRCAFRRPLSGVKIRNAGGRRLPAGACLPDDRGPCRRQMERGGSTLTRSRRFLAHAPTPIFHSLVFFLHSLGGYGPAVFELCHSRRTGPASLRLPRRPRCSLLRELVNQAHYAFAHSDFRLS